MQSNDHSDTDHRSVSVKMAALAWRTKWSCWSYRGGECEKLIDWLTDWLTETKNITNKSIRKLAKWERNCTIFICLAKWELVKPELANGHCRNGTSPANTGVPDHKQTQGIHGTWQTWNTTTETWIAYGICHLACQYLYMTHKLHQRYSIKNKTTTWTMRKSLSHIFLLTTKIKEPPLTWVNLHPVTMIQQLLQLQYI